MMLEAGEKTAGAFSTHGKRPRMIKQAKKKTGRYALLNEEEATLNLQGTEMVGDTVELWKNLLKYDEKYGLMKVGSKKY